MAGGKLIGESMVYAREAGFTEQFSYVASGNGQGQIEYQGKAPAGTLSTTARWQLRRFTYDSDSRITAIEWATGSDGFDHVWNDRATLTYA